MQPLIVEYCVSELTNFQLYFCSLFPTSGNKTKHFCHPCASAQEILEDVSEMPGFRATPHNLARRLSQDFCPNSKFGKRRNTVCISRFSNWRSGAKRRLRLAGTIVRCCLREEKRLTRSVSYWKLRKGKPGMSSFTKAVISFKTSIVHFTGFVNTLEQAIFPTLSHKAPQFLCILTESSSREDMSQSGSSIPFRK